MRLALVQMDLAWEDVAENHRRARRHLERAKDGGARLALLPEMFCTGFSMESDRIAQPRGGSSETFLRETARELDLWILASIPEAGEPRPRNMALLAGPDGTLARYAKIHPFTFGGEHRVYAGGEGIVTVPVEGVRVTPFVCYDLRFPEPFRLVAAETDLFAVVANWPEGATRGLAHAPARPGDRESLLRRRGQPRRRGREAALRRRLRGRLAVGRRPRRGRAGGGRPLRGRGSRGRARRAGEVPGPRRPAPRGVPALDARLSRRRRARGRTVLTRKTAIWPRVFGLSGQ